LTIPAPGGHYLRVVWRRSREHPISRDEMSALIRLLMGTDWKLDRIIEELGIENGEAEDRP
jgi:hypothetical protein